MWVPGSVAFLLPLFGIGVRLLFGRGSVTSQRRGRRPRSGPESRAESAPGADLIARADPPPTADLRPATSGFDLLRLPLLGRFLNWRHARLCLQVPLLLLAARDRSTTACAARQVGAMNLAGVLPWIHWRGLRHPRAAGGRQRLLHGLSRSCCPGRSPAAGCRPAGTGRGGCGASGWRSLLLVALPVGLRGVRPLGQPVVDGLDRPGLLRRGLRHRRPVPRRLLLQVPLPDRPVQLRAVAGLAAGGQGARPGRLRVVPDEGLHPRPRRHPRLRAAPVPAAQGGQHGLHRSASIASTPARTTTSA